MLMGLMDPYVSSSQSLCLLELVNFPFCPGEGLGHAIAFTFRGEISQAMQAHPFGLPAVLILLGRIGYLWKRAFISHKINREEL